MKKTNKSNGHQATKDLEKTADVEEVEETKQSHVMTRNSWQNAYSAQEGYNSLNLLAKSGEDPLDLLMRTSLADYQLMVAFATLISACEEFHDTEGANEVRNMLAMMPSIAGLSRKQIVDAMIGGYGGQSSGGEEDFTSKLKRMAFGK